LEAVSLSHRLLLLNEVLALATLRPKQEQWMGVVMAAVLRRRVPSTSPRPWSRQSSSMRIAQAPTRLAAVASPAHQGVADDAVGSAGRSCGARLMTALTVSSGSAR
jgi:hypothetical protein